MDVMGWMMDATVVEATGSGNRSGTEACPEFMMMGLCGHFYINTR